MGLSILEAISQLSPSNLEARGSSCRIVHCDDGHELSSLPYQATKRAIKIKCICKVRKKMKKCIKSYNQGHATYLFLFDSLIYQENAHLTVV